MFSICNSIYNYSIVFIIIYYYNYDYYCYNNNNSKSHRIFFWNPVGFPKKIIDFGWEIYEDSDQKCNVL